MPRKNPLGKLKDTAIDTIKHPIGSGQKVVDQAVGGARGTVGLGKAVAGQVTRSATEKAVGTLGVVTSLVPGLKAGSPGAPAHPAPGQSAPDPVAEPAAPSRPHGDPVAPVGRTTAKPDPAAPAAPSGRATSAAVTEGTTKKTAARKTAAEKTTAKAPAAKKSPAKKTATRKSTAKKVSPPPLTAIDAAADPADVDVTPADVAQAVAKKAPAKRAAKKTTTRSAKAPAARKTPPSAAPGDKLPLSAAELAAGAGTETITPVGTRGADVAHNPDTTETDLQQVGTEPLVDPATVKAVASEAAILSKASDPHKG